MKSKEVDIDGKKFTITEIPYVKATEIDRTDDKKAGLELMKISGISQEQLETLTLREGVTLQQEIVEFNGLKDFLPPTEKKA